MSHLPVEYLRHIRDESVDYDVVWNVQQEDIPVLRRQIEHIIEKENP